MKLRFPEKNISLFLLPFLLCTTACNSWQEGWTEEYRQEFTQSCLAGDGRLHPDSKAYCDCALDKTMQQYPTIAAFMEQRDTAAYRNTLRTCP